MSGIAYVKNSKERIVGSVGAAAKRGAGCRSRCERIHISPIYGGFHRLGDKFVLFFTGKAKDSVGLRLGRNAVVVDGFCRRAEMESGGCKGDFDGGGSESAVKTTVTEAETRDSSLVVEQ